MLLEGRVAFLTGAGSGIGRAGAIALAREGAVVTVTDLDGRRAMAVADEIKANGGQAEAMALDAGNEAAVIAAIDRVAVRSRLDILHSHVGIQIPGRLTDVTCDDMDASWRLNVRAHFIAARAAMTHMRPQRAGSIIITASNSGVQFDRGMIAYTTTKHAVIAMARQIAADYAGDNVRCNALCPGFVDTPFNTGFETQMGGRTELEAYVGTSIPMRRWATVEEISASIVYLASDQSSFMTGHALVVDGGECL
jgi:NAD(P)-dependent dehydrogenase (short-subunit alcohol dehydrogenase family)